MLKSDFKKEFYLELKTTIVIDVLTTDFLKMLETDTNNKSI